MLLLVSDVAGLVSASGLDLVLSAFASLLEGTALSSWLQPCSFSSNLVREVGLM